MFNEITSGLLFERVFVWPTGLHSPVDFWEELPLHPLVVVIALSISLWKKIFIVFISPAFSLIKSFSTIQIVFVWWRTCPKGFLLAGFASYFTLCLQYTNEILSFHLAEGSLPSPWYFFSFLGSFSEDFKLFRLLPYVIVLEFSHRRKVVCSTNLLCSSIGNKVVSFVSDFMSSKPFHNMRREPITSRNFCWNLLINESWLNS